MALNINGTTGISGIDGSVTAPALTGTDSNTGITFPAADTIKLSTGGTERLQIANAGVHSDGHVCQVVTNSTNVQAESSSTTYVDTNLTCNITPKFANSDVLVLVHQEMQLLNDTANGFGVQLLRDSVVIEEGKPFNATGPFMYYFGNFGANMNFYFFHNSSILDTPSYSVGDTITYKTQMRIYQAINSRTVRAQSNTGTSGNSGVSFIQLLEVGG